MDTYSSVAVSGARRTGAGRSLSRLNPPNRVIEGVIVVIGYSLVAALLYHTPLLHHPSSQAAGLGLPDNDAYVWMLAWPEHAIANGLGLFHPNIVFVPEGYNLAKATPMFTFGVILAPVTALAGPLVTYNIVMLAMPALNGAAAYALCRRLGARPAAAALGGFVYAASGLVSFSALGAPSTGFGAFVPLAVLFTIDLLDEQRQRQRRRWRSAIWLGITLVAQLYSSAEMLTTLVLFGLLALVLFWVLDRQRRPAMRAALPNLAVAVAILAVGSIPYLLAFAFDGGGALSHADPDHYPNDLLAFVIPSSLQRVGRAYFSSLASTFPGESDEAYLGIGLVIVTVWSLAERWRAQAGIRVLGVMLAVIAICSLGTHLTIAGHTTIPLPWALVRHLPLLRYAIPSRLSLYLALGAGVALALWLSRRSGTLRWGPGLLRWVVALASCALLIPNPSVHWSSTLPTPRFFTSGAAARAFSPSDRVLIVPFAGPDEQDQARAGYAFSLAGGYLGQYPPSYGDYPAASYLIRRVSPPGAPAQVARLVHDKGVDAVVVDPSQPGPWRQLFSGLGVQPTLEQGALVYRLKR